MGKKEQQAKAFMPQLQLCLIFFTNNSNSQELENLDVTTPYKHV
jgi:hypothetical protein